MFNFGSFWSQVKLSEPTSVLSYLGIQRRNADEENSPGTGNKPEQKAKKSFRPSVVVEQTDLRLAYLLYLSCCCCCRVDDFLISFHFFC